jgi:endonuclease YncB( thermonuclease family)
LKSSQTITQFIASRSMAILPSECAPAVALDGESIWEIGTVVRVVDGDTVDVQTCRGELNVRQLGIQAPETAKRTHVAQCGGVQASEFMRMLLPVGSQVQLRSNNHAAANNSCALARPYRHIFAKDVEGSFTINVQAKLLETGLAMWSPNDNEFVGNYQYLELLNDAAKRGVGLWSGASCKNDRVKTPVGAIEMWVETDSPLPNENPFGGYVLLRNTTRADIDISEWSIRDTSLELFDSKYAFASGTILKSQETLTVYLGTALANFPLGPNEISLGLSHAILQNPSPVGAKYTGDGISLQTPLLANGGRNMRAWSHRPCVPTDCPKPEWLIENPDGAARATPSPQTLSIALNPQRFGLVVPDMTGLTEEQAKVALTPLRLNVIIFDRSNGAAGEKRVVEENPKSGAILPAGGAVTVNVDVQR